MISLVYYTYRPGGFDLLADGLKNQAGDYELVVIDDYEPRSIRAASDYLLDRHIPLAYYGRSKPHCYPDQRLYGTFNACNTGFRASNGDVVFLCQDYTWLPPRTIEHWAKLQTLEKTRVIVCGAEIIACSPPGHLGDLTIWDEDIRSVLETAHLEERWMPQRFDMRCVGFPRTFLEEINGIDERNDCHPYSILDSVPWQMSQLGYELYVDREWPLVMVRHDQWEGKWWHASRIIPDGRKPLAWDPRKDVRSPNC
jgi:hypothetical protein